MEAELRASQDSDPSDCAESEDLRAGAGQIVEVDVSAEEIIEPEATIELSSSDQDQDRKLDIPPASEPDSDNDAHHSPVPSDCCEATKFYDPAAAIPATDLTAPYNSATQEDPDATQTLVPQAGSGLIRYTVLRPHARGGLGVVSIARDEELGREVAFKELRDRFADDTEAQSRFILEAEITGTLEHPGIVPIYGLGRDANGRPFYAMRFIRGESLKNAIADYHRQPGRNRRTHSGERHVRYRKLLSSFIAVCQAVQFAHSRGIVHRDIKPANIMLGEFGETLVVDWGLAKAAGAAGRAMPEFQAASSGTSVPTQMGTVIGTPTYMSPEQASGQHDQVGPASDVYSLGATFFTLLTGKQAFQQNDLIDILEAVRDGDFPKPRELNSHVPPALESICLKAMSRDPAARYGSCLQLAEDIEHWLADEPVIAHQETVLERAARWSRRHRAWTRAISVAVAVVAVVALVAVVVVNRAREREKELAIANANLAESERASRQQAVARLQQARTAVDTWLTGLSDTLRYVPGVQHARQRLLEQAAADYEKFTLQENKDPDLELERARTYLRLGDVQRILGQLTDAENSYRSAVELFQQLRMQYPARQDMQVEWANGQTRLAVQLADRERLQEAQLAYGQAEEKLHQVLESASDDVQALDALATNRLNHANLLRAGGANSQAIVAFREAADLFEQLQSLAPSNTRFVAGHATSLSLLGQQQVNQGEAMEGLEILHDSLNSFRNLIAREPDNPSYIESHANTLIHIANVSRSLGDYQQEQESYENASHDYERLAEMLPTVPLFAQNLAITWADLGQLLYDRGETEKAAEILARSVSQFTELTVQDPQYHPYTEGLAFCRETLGRVLSDLGQDVEAGKIFELALAAYQQLAQETDVRAYQERLAVCRSYYGQLLHKQGDYDAARVAFDLADRALTQLIEYEPETCSYQDERAFVQQQLGLLMCTMDENEAAERAFVTARKTWEELITSAPQQPEYRNHLAWFLVNCPIPQVSDPKTALEYARQATEAAPKKRSISDDARGGPRS